MDITIKYSKKRSSYENKFHKFYFIKGKSHRKIGPAKIYYEYALSGSKTIPGLYWYWKNLYHRIDGPAVVFEGHSMNSENWRFLGNEYDEEEYWQI